MKRGVQTKRCANKADKVERKFLPKRRLVILVCFAILISQNLLATESQPTTLKELIALSPAQLESCDIARMNLICAEGLPGAENLNVDKDLATLDEWAQHIKSETDRNFHHFQEDPANYYNSTNFYKMLMMAVVLYEDYNIRYNPKWIEAPTEIQGNDHFAADSRDILIHGLIGDRRMGTCGSMPVLYVALARRLGYPVKLVTTKEHLFMRWESPTERFDMDATGKGLDKYDDDFYKKFPFPISEQEIKDEGYLKSLSPAEELSIFLSTRGQCLMEAGRLAEATASFNAAYRLEPNWKGNQILLADAQQRMIPRYLPLYSRVSHEQQALDAIPDAPGVDTGTPKIPDPDPMKQMWLRQQQLQNQTLNPIPNP
ncbi:MAG: transglutaminase family protein [Limisphaerales bacterium]